MLQFTRFRMINSVIYGKKLEKVAKKILREFNNCDSLLSIK